MVKSIPYIKSFSHSWFLFLLFLLSPFCAVHAQTKILSPEDFLGYSLGNRFTPHHKVEEYFNYVSSQSEQVQILNYGKTYEHRPLFLAFISSKENLKNLENIRENNLKRAGILEGSPPDTGPGILWFSYNVHGNESASTEASLATLYALVNPEDQEKQKWLSNTVIIIDPVLNPDGRERYVNFYTQFANKSPNPNPDSKEHNEPWPGGRTNHYLFDLNRDWAWQTQIESQQRMKVYNHWLPHVHVDFHEQGYNDPYYFAPAAEPLHDVITKWQRDFQEEIGINHTKYFDKNNWLYFTKERFDLFYPSYGDTYPMYNGAIGMTYEQGGSGRAGLKIVTSEKDTLTLTERILHHYTTGMSTIEISSKNAEKLVLEFEKFFSESKTNPSSLFKTYVVKNIINTNKKQDLMLFLDRMGIVYGYGKPMKNIKGHHYPSGSIQTFSIRENDLIISAFQPKSALLQVLFDPKPHLSDTVTYDITSWSVPYMFDVETYATETKIIVDKKAELKALSKLNAKDLPYAYLTEWNNIAHLKFLTRLLSAGVKVRFTSEPFKMNGKQYAEGSLIITRNGNKQLDSSFDDIVTSEALKLNIEIQPASTGMVGGGKDFGSSSVKRIHAPKVAVVGGKNISSLAFGEVWHFFEQEINYPITVLDTEYLNEIDFSPYDVLIFPGGKYGSIFTDEFLEQLKIWVNNGGNLILMEDALASIAGKPGFELQKLESDEEKAEAEDKKVREKQKIKDPELYKNRIRNDISNYSLGGIYKISLDNSHPLGFGYPTHYYTLKINPDVYPYLNKGWNVGTVKDNSSLMSGFVGHKIQEKLKDALIFGVQEANKGTLVYLVDNPLFRSFWYNGKLLFGNAIFMVGQ